MREYKLSTAEREAKRRYYYENRDRILAQKKKYYREHGEKYYQKNKHHYHENKDIRKEQVKLRQLLFQARVRDIKRQAGCSVDGCNVTDPDSMDLDHIDPKEKLWTISRGVNAGRAWSLIMAEIDKCQVLCANHHRQKTARQTYGRYKQTREQGSE